MSACHNLVILVSPGGTWCHVAPGDTAVFEHVAPSCITAGTRSRDEAPRRGTSFPFRGLDRSICCRRRRHGPATAPSQPRYSPATTPLKRRHDPATAPAQHPQNPRHTPPQPGHNPPRPSHRQVLSQHLSRNRCPRGGGGDSIPMPHLPTFPPPLNAPCLGFFSKFTDV